MLNLNSRKNSIVSFLFFFTFIANLNSMRKALILFMLIMITGSYLAITTSCRKEQVIISTPPIVHTDTVYVQPPAPHKCGTIFFSVGAVVGTNSVNFMIKVRWEDGTESTITITGLYNQYQVGQLFCI